MDNQSQPIMEIIVFRLRQAFSKIQLNTSLGLSIAQVALTIVSWVTTYKGFLLILQPPILALLASFGLQSLVFYIPRRLHLAHSFRLLRHLLIFISAACISILFSYQALISELVPKQLKEEVTTTQAFNDAQDIINKAHGVVMAAKNLADKNVQEDSTNAYTELKYGGTNINKNTKAGPGREYRTWMEEYRKAKTTQNILNGFLEQTDQDVEEIDALKSKNNTDKRIRLSALINHIITVAQNSMVIQLLEHADDTLFYQKEISIARNIKTPNLHTGEEHKGSIEDKDRFMEGLQYAYIAFSKNNATHGLDEFHTGAIISLLIATIIDLLILILGWVSTTESITSKVKKTIKIILEKENQENESVGILRHLVRIDNDLGIRITRDKYGKSLNITSRQDIALQILKTKRFVKLLPEKTNGEEKSEVLIIKSGEILDTIINNNEG